MKKILEAFGEPISHGGQEAFIFNVLRNINMEGLQMDFFTPYYCDNPSAEKLIREKGGNLFTTNQFKGILQSQGKVLKLDVVTTVPFNKLNKKYLIKHNR